MDYQSRLIHLQLLVPHLKLLTSSLLSGLSEAPVSILLSQILFSLILTTLTQVQISSSSTLFGWLVALCVSQICRHFQCIDTHLVVMNLISSKPLVLPTVCLYNPWCLEIGERYALLMRANKPETAVQSSGPFSPGTTWFSIMSLITV